MRFLEAVIDGYLWLTDSVKAHPHRTVWIVAAIIIAALVF